MTYNHSGVVARKFNHRIHNENDFDMHCSTLYGGGIVPLVLASGPQVNPSPTIIIGMSC